MAQPSSTSSSDLGRLGRAIGLTLGLIVLVELSLAFVPENVMIRTMRWMRKLVGREAAPTVQIFGDSVAQGALFPTEIVRFLPRGTTVRNAALQGSGPEFTYFLFKQQVAEGNAPRAIVLAHSPHTYVTERTGVLVGAFLRWPEVPEALFASHHFFDGLYGVLCRFSFSLRHRDEMSELLKGRRDAIATWNADIPTEAWVRATMDRDETRWAHEPKGPLPPLHPVYRQAFVVDAGEREFLARTLALAHARGITVWWLSLPEHVAVAAARDSIDFAPVYYAFVDSLAARGEVQLLRRDLEVLGPENFVDYTHLRRAAALRLSREVGAKLAEDLGTR